MILNDMILYDVGTFRVGASPTVVLRESVVEVEPPLSSPGLQLREGLLEVDHLLAVPRLGAQGRQWHRYKTRQDKIRQDKSKQNNENQ